MRPPIPARITIELLPPEAASDGWTARTTVSGAEDAGRDPLAVVVAGEARVEGPAPAVYEAEGCTCHEGWCGRDHDND